MGTSLIRVENPSTERESNKINQAKHLIEEQKL